MNISITPDALSQLRHLQQKSKFTEEDFYPGAPTEEIRVKCERRVNEFLSDLVSSLRMGTEKDHVFARARMLTETFAKDDTEEREKVGDYIGEAMRIIGLEDWTEHV